MEMPDKWGFWVKFILTPVIVCTGIVGNTLSIVVMQSKALRHKSYSRYLSALAVFDTLTLIIRQVRCINDYYASENNVHVVFKNFDTFGCKMFNFIEHVSYLMSSWLIVLMGLERLIAVCMPFKKVVIRTQTGAMVTIIFMFVLISLSQAFRLVMVEYSEAYFCNPSGEYLQLYTDLHIYFYHCTLAFALPVSLVFGCNGMVLYQIFKIKREIRKEDKKNRQYRAVRERHRTTYMLLIVSFTFLGTLMPVLTLNLVLHILMKVKGREGHAIYRDVSPFLELAVTISLLNYAINFFIYVLSGKSFRFELRKVLRRRTFSTRSFTGRSTREEFLRLGQLPNGSSTHYHT